MKKPRTKKYAGPKYVAKNPMITFFGGMSAQHAQHLQSTLLTNHTAMSNMARGVGDENDWDRLNGAVNMSLVMSEQGIGAEYTEEFKAASYAMLACIRRALKTGRYLFTGEELKAMNEAMDSHDAQLTCIRAIDVDRAANEVIRRLAHRINVASIHEKHPEVDIA
jgi:hypothetical protein